MEIFEIFLMFVMLGLFCIENDFIGNKLVFNKFLYFTGLENVVKIGINIKMRLYL